MNKAFRALRAATALSVMTVPAVAALAPTQAMAQTAPVATQQHRAGPLGIDRMGESVRIYEMDRNQILPDTMISINTRTGDVNAGGTLYQAGTPQAENALRLADAMGRAYLEFATGNRRGGAWSHRIVGSLIGNIGIQAMNGNGFGEAALGTALNLREGAFSTGYNRRENRDNAGYTMLANAIESARGASGRAISARNQQNYIQGEQADRESYMCTRGREALAVSPRSASAQAMVAQHCRRQP